MHSTGHYPYWGGGGYANRSTIGDILKPRIDSLGSSGKAFTLQNSNIRSHVFVRT